MDRPSEVSPRRQLTVAWRSKLLMALVLPLLLSIPYFLLQRYTIFSAHTFRLSRLDLAVPFRPGWVWVYLSFHAIVYTVPWAGRSAADLRRFACGFALLTSLSFAVFLLYPVTGPRPENIGDSPLYRMTVACDRPLNSYPSLHAGLLVYVLIFGWRATRTRLPIWIMIVMLIWAGLILYSTLAIKEHYAIDLLAGGVVAVICDAIVWRRRDDSSPLVESH